MALTEAGDRCNLWRRRVPRLRTGESRERHLQIKRFQTHSSQCWVCFTSMNRLESAARSAPEKNDYRKPSCHGIAAKSALMFCNGNRVADRLSCECEYYTIS